MNYPIFPGDCKSLLSKYLTPELFESLKELKTPNGFTLEQAINSGVVNLDSGIGVYAGDQDSYRVFAPLFDPIIEEYHGFGKDDKHKSNLNSDDLQAPNPDPEGSYIVSTRIRVGRNVESMPLGPGISKEQRDEVESSVVEGLQTLEGELAGEYYPLLGMSKEIQNKCSKDHFGWKVCDLFFDAALQYIECRTSAYEYRECIPRNRGAA